MTPISTTTHDHCHVATILNINLIDTAIINYVFRDIDIADVASGHRLIINFKNVNRVSSSVLGKLVGLRKRIMNEKGRLTLCCCGENMTEAMKVTNLRLLFDVMETEDEAVEYMRHDVVGWKPGAEVVR